LSRYSASKNLPFSCGQLFDIAAGIEQYPEFLPGWANVHITERSRERLQVQQTLGFGLLRMRFSSSAILKCPHSVHVSSQDGPFELLEIEWHFKPVDEQLCQVSLDIELVMKNTALGKLADRFFSSNAQQTMDRFSRRAREVYGYYQSGADA
jgi:ribosome-associated toxin RatA of RatAB toxin-antitoxin module